MVSLDSLSSSAPIEPPTQLQAVLRAMATTQADDAQSASSAAPDPSRLLDVTA